jgi:hypothetical protein
MNTDSRRKVLTRAGFTAGAVVILLAGAAIGAASANQAGLVSSQKTQIARLEQSITGMRGQVATAKTQAATARTTAASAVSAANTQAAAKYASREAAVQRMQRKLARELGTVARSTISADGVYVVGRDIPAGTYHTSGNSGGLMQQCYFATLGSTDTSNILDNNNFNGPETVSLSGVYAFQITGGCTWHREG